METELKPNRQTGEHVKWFDDLSDQINMADPQCFSVPVVTFRQPTQLSAHERYQVCAIAFALLLSVGITADEFKTRTNSPAETDAASFKYSMQEEGAYITSLRLLKCRLPEKESKDANEVKGQIIGLVTELLNMFGIPVSYFINVQEASIRRTGKI